jgi:hypothetical protein
MDPTTLLLLLQSAGGIAQLFASGGHLQRPTMNIPQEIGTSTNIATELANQNQVSGASNITSQMGADVSTAINKMSAATDNPNALLGSISNLYANKQKQERELGVQGEALRLGNMGNLQNALNNQANWKQKQWGYNVANKYEEEAAASSAMKGAGLQNLFQGLSNFAAANIKGSADKQYLDIVNQLFGDNNTFGGAGNVVGNNTNISNEISNDLSKYQKYTDLMKLLGNVSI